MPGFGRPGTSRTPGGSVWRRTNIAPLSPGSSSSDTIDRALMSTTQIHTEIDLDRPSGKQRGNLAIPYSHNLGGWANLLVPICVVRNGEGPTVLLMAGNHGDEYPGQAANLKLSRVIEPVQIN